MVGNIPEGNIITEGNISPNPPSGGSINDILYRKTKMFMQNIKACQSFIKIFHAFFGCLQISEGLNSKFCWLLCVLGVLFLRNSLNFFIRFINHINLFRISRHFCCFKVRGSHACHGIYFVFHRNTRNTRVLPWNTKYIPWHTQYAWDWVKCSEKSHSHVVQIGFFDWTIWICGVIYNLNTKSLAGLDSPARNLWPSIVFIIYRPAARGKYDKYHHWKKYFAESNELRFYK